MLVIACNTATAVALEEIKEKLAIPVIGVILPGSRAAVKASKNQRIGVIGTNGTIKSDSYKRALHGKAPHASVVSLACPKFVPIVESKQYHSSVAKKIVAETLRPLKNKRLDTVILGCTHYPLLRPLIQNELGAHIQLIDSGAETVGKSVPCWTIFPLQQRVRTIRIRNMHFLLLVHRKYLMRLPMIGLI